MAVATAIALGTAAVSAGTSFAQAAKQKKVIKEAENEAQKKMASARKSLEKNYMESLSIPMEAYEAQNEAILVAGSIAMDAAKEGSQRGAGTVAQNVLNASNDALRDTSTRQAEELYNLEAATAEEESRLRDIGVGLDLQEVEGANMVAADAELARSNAIQAGIGSLMDGVGTGLDAAGLYRTDKGMQKAALQSQFDDTRAKGLSIAKDSDFLIDPSAYGRGKDFGEGFKPRDYRKAKRRYDFTNPDYNRRYAAGIESFYNSNSGFLD
tara:strand:+ start:265 stop:1068 length:804 start_codon:yes stop_codon:yes gene_type:complete